MSTINTLNNWESWLTHRNSLNTNFTNLNNDKVEKITWKWLSENDYTTTEKNKLANIWANARVITVTWWDNVVVNNSDPTNPIINSLWWGWGTIIPLPTYTITNNTHDRTVDLNITSLDEVWQVLWTLVNDIETWLTWIANSTDFYKYQIVPTVDWSWNLTVTLLNYAWQTPSVTAPVKVQIWWVIRTITSWVNLHWSYLIPWWSNYLNLWSSELSTKEVDLFVYLCWDSLSQIHRLAVSRIPSANKIWDWFYNSWNIEKWSIWSNNNIPTDPVQNIWRFSAILSDWPWYTWSLWTWPIINYYINETRWLNWAWQLSCSWGMTVTSPVINTAKYRINWQWVDIILKYSWTLWGILSNDFRCTLPFAPADSNLPCAMVCWNNFDFLASWVMNSWVYSSISARAWITSWTLWPYRTAWVNTFYAI